MLSGLSIGHLLVVLLIVVALFGTSKLRNIGKDLGGAVKGFKDAMREGEDEQSQKQITQQQTTTPQHDHEKRKDEV